MLESILFLFIKYKSNRLPIAIIPSVDSKKFGELLPPNYTWF